jgi:iron complex outermembrane recepter protein
MLSARMVKPKELRKIHPGTGQTIRHVYLAAVVSAIFVALPQGPVSAAQSTSELIKLSLEQLMNVEVTSVARKPQRVSESAAAVHVISSEDIRRSGATSIPELLRNVPGLNVARIDSSKWAISARGFNGRFSNKLLVLMDGRTLYTPLFSGVFWDVQDTFLDDIERIEVIRGPGGTVWGANAVNGVINIITKSADKTNGTVVSGLLGTEERGSFAARHGQAIDQNSNFRAFVKHSRRDNSPLETGQDGSDDWDIQRGGFRYDNKSVRGGKLMLQGEAYTGNAGQFVASPALTSPFTNDFSNDARVNGQFMLGRWSSEMTDNSQTTFQSYFDRASRSEFHADTVTLSFDMEAQHRLKVGEIHDLIAGLGYRFNRDDIVASTDVSFDPSHDTYHLFSAFLQDEISLAEDVKVTLGAKFEHNSFSGFEIQPSARILWQVDRTNTLWTSVSRAVRTPSRAADAVTFNSAVIPGAPPIQTRVFGSTEVRSEELTALEVGYKTRPLPALSIDIAAFYNIYDRLLTTEQGTAFVEASPAPVHLVLPLTFANNMSGEAYGVEVGADWRARGWLRLRAAYTYFELELRRAPGRGVASNEAAEDRDPRHQLSLTTQFDIAKNLELDITLRAVDRLTERRISGYATADFRLAWRPRENIELSLVGQNLGQSRHLEFRPEFLGTKETEVERAFYGKVKVSF